MGGGAYGGKTYLGSMLAAQYLRFPEYQCLVTRKNRKELIGPNSIWRNLKEWLTREELGPLKLDPRTDINKSDLVMTAPSGGTIWFRFYEDDEAMGKLQSESYDRIIHDEGPQLRPRVSKFSYRSLRHGDFRCKIPLAMIILGNPSVEPKSSNDYVTETYVDGPYSYYWMDWRHNPFAPSTYKNTLLKLDFIDQKLQLDGDWHYRPAKGELFPELKLEAIKINQLPSTRIVRNVRGLDLAVTKKGDRTAFFKWFKDEHGYRYIVDVVCLKTEYPEETFIDVIEADNPDWRNKVFETEYFMELEPGSSGTHQKRFFKSVLSNYIKKGLSLTFRKSSTNKFTRARPMARDIRNNMVSIVVGNDRNVMGEPWVDTLVDELKDFGPNDKEYDYDDQVDAGSIGFNELDKSKAKVYGAV